MVGFYKRQNKKKKTTNNAIKLTPFPVFENRDIFYIDEAKINPGKCNYVT